MEEWREVEGYPYEVSNEGRVRRSEDGPSTFAGKILCPVLGNRGYMQVALSRKGEIKLFRVHRLVAIAFLPRVSEEDTEVNHRDFDRTNNRLCNLEWGTSAHNTNHKVAAGRHAFGAGHGRAKLTTDEVFQIRHLLSEGEKGAAIARAFGVSATTISDISTGKCWRHLL